MAQLTGFVNSPMWPVAPKTKKGVISHPLFVADETALYFFLAFFFGAAFFAFFIGFSLLSTCRKCLPAVSGAVSSRKERGVKRPPPRFPGALTSSSWLPS
jgi:hypothetical protein